ncbi:hypothetical protein QBZ16_004968 [Prototheca wickerhamii]|uniref:tRNA (adenine(58)-N(1))-methyltransferase non-catalytic subunit TRM6 n=1 Tax=Prototheca wickerhamii TaxID=3111 RepID=A0AAD9IHN9_PROWI|nr:hypothetical protein QBZ16_004968 [Prototheca wickerhamii]
MNDDRHIFVVVRGRNRIKLGRSYCPVQPLIGCPYGATFGLGPDGRSLQQIPHTVPADWLETATEVTKDNSMLVDGGDAHQKLTSEEIAELRHKLRDGEAIVDALTQHSATFASKTEFAQAKYKKKKAKKVRGARHRAPRDGGRHRAGLLPAASRRGSGTSAWTRSPCSSPWPTSAPGARVLAVDACGGLVLGAAAERLGGHGAVQGAFFGARAPSREALSQFDCPRVAEVVREHAVEDVLAAARRGAAVEGADTAPPLSGFSCCIVAAPSLDPSSVLATILPLLRPSAAFAVYSPWQQPLAEAMHELRTAHRAVNLSLQESWWRAAQVLPGRTHPTMQMNHGGGYVLSGVTVAPP